jgi:hypothetical protein
MGLRIDAQGTTRDKYGRAFEFDEKDFQKRRRAKAVHPAAKAVKLIPNK